MEIGDRLKEARESKNLSLRDVQETTKIQTKYLQAIEEGNFDIMPGSFYVRAFIKEYAGAVGLNPEQLLEEHQNELPSSSGQGSIQYTNVKKSKGPGSSSTKSDVFSVLPTLIVGVLIIGIVFSVWFFYQASTGEEAPITEENGTTEEGGEEIVINPPEGSGDEDQTNSEENDENTSSDEEASEGADQQTEPQEPALEFVEQGNQGNEQTALYRLVNPSEEVLLEISTESTHWLEISNQAGENIYEKMFTAEDSPLSEDMTGQNKFGIRVGEPADISIVIDGVPLEFPKEANLAKIQRITINVENESESQ